ncbi:SH3 domain-containing protein [Salipiger sp. H15]|uniref:SH3 domain-containing protein n=1 Tax=Alloyangia sp. H15 TaxID=3029062 RepID=A0AAU8ADZ6_9RHOB
MTPRAALLALVLGLPPALQAQTVPPLPETAFVFVTSGGTLRLRDAPSTTSPVLAQLEPGQLLRNLGCLAEPEPWCQVQSLDGARAGWVAGGYLAPFAGADPAALSSPAVPATQLRELELGPGLVEGALAPGEILDLVTRAAPDEAISLRLDAPGNIALAAFVRPATLLARGDAGTPVSVVLPEGGDLLIRLADRSGAGGDWQLIITLD